MGHSTLHIAGKIVDHIAHNHNTNHKLACVIFLGSISSRPLCEVDCGHLALSFMLSKILLSLIIFDSIKTLQETHIEFFYNKV